MFYSHGGQYVYNIALFNLVTTYKSMRENNEFTEHLYSDMLQMKEGKAKCVYEPDRR